MTILDGLKAAGDALREADKIPQYQQILDAQQKMLEMQGRIMELEQEHRKLKEERETESVLQFRHDAYWRAQGGPEDGPFCSHCWDKERLLIRLHKTPAEYADCPACKVVVNAYDIVFNPVVASEPRDPYSSI